MDADCCLLRLPAVLAAAAAAAAGEDDSFCRSNSSKSSSRRSTSASSLAYLGSCVPLPPWRSCFADGAFLRGSSSARRWVLARSPLLWGCSVFTLAGRESFEMGVSDEEEERRPKGEDSGESFVDSAENRRGSSSSSSETTSSEEAPPLGWPCRNRSAPPENVPSFCDETPKPKPSSPISEMEMMKERFAKLLLGEDMSGCGKGVCTALSISNAITNLCGSVFGQIWRLEPLPAEKKALWRREMEWLLCVGDYIVELSPSVQTFPDGSKLEVMSCRQRPDLFIDLPALRKLDNMLLEILDEFSETEFWYFDQGIVAAESDGGSGKTVKRQEEKWWLPVPRVPAGGLQEAERNKLQLKRESTSQILKAAMAINSNALADMEIPKSYLESLPKNGKAALGETIYRYITSEQFSPECLLDYLDLSSEHRALEIANRVEASMFVWRRRENAPPRPNGNRWGGMVRDLIGDAERRELLADRAESLLICLKQRFPTLTQTTLDTTKIQCNKDVGKSILESYSRVLESLASNVIARIDDLLYVDDRTKKKQEGKFSPSNSKPAQRRSAAMVPLSSAATPYATPSFSPAPARSPATSGGGRRPFLARKAAPPHHQTRGFGVKKALTDYLVGVGKNGASSNAVESIK